MRLFKNAVQVDIKHNTSYMNNSKSMCCIILKNNQTGITLIEIMIVTAIIGLLSMVALPAYQDYQDRAIESEAINDITSMGLTLLNYHLDNGELPIDLASIGLGGKLDPWGNPYQYINHDIAPKGKRRKDKNLVPINNDFDLYSMGEDGRSVAPLTAKHSRDDIVRANNGGWTGKAEDY